MTKPMIPLEAAIENYQRYSEIIKVMTIGFVQISKSSPEDAAKIALETINAANAMIDIFRFDRQYQISKKE
jgi:hypothetical protein